MWINRLNMRETRVLRGATVGIAARGFSLLGTFLLVPVTIRYLGNERFGVWMTLNTLMVWASLFDFGIGNGLVNLLAKDYATDNHISAQKHISNGLFFLVFVCVALGAVLLAFGSRMDWVWLLGIKADANRDEISQVVTAMGLCFLLSIPLSLAQKIFSAYQQTALGYVWGAISSLAAVAATFGVIQLNGGLRALIFAFAGAPLIISLISIVFLFTFQYPELRPSAQNVRWQGMQILLAPGLQFFVLQAAALILHQSDNFVIANILGADQVAEYSVVYRLFSYVGMLHSIIIAPMWPAYAEAYAEGDIQWIRSALQRTLKYSLLVGGASIAILIVIGKQFVFWWTAGQVDPSQMLIILIATWMLMSIWGNTIAMAQNGMGRIRIQMIGAVLMAIVNIGLSIYLAKNLGSIGVITATVVSYGCISLWLGTYDTFNTLKNYTKISS